MGVMQSIPFCSRGQAKNAGEAGAGGAVPPLVLDNNNNDPTVVVNNQPVAASAPEVAVDDDVSGPPPDATSTPRQMSDSMDDGLELSSGFENPHFDQSKAAADEALDDSDDIGPVVDQVIGGSSSDEDDSGLALQEFRKRHNMDGLRRETMTPPPVHESSGGDFEEFGDDLLDDDDDDDDETINVEDADSRDGLSSSDSDPVERPPEPRVPEEDPKRLSGSSEDEDRGVSPEVKSPYFSKDDPTTAAITTMLSDIVGVDKPHADMTHAAISR